MTVAKFVQTTNCCETTRKSCRSAHASEIKVISGAHSTRFFNLQKTEINFKSNQMEREQERAQKKIFHSKFVSSFSFRLRQTPQLTPEAIKHNVKM